VQSIEPPCTDPYARWCGRGRRVAAAPMPIKSRCGKRSGGQDSHLDGQSACRKLNLRRAMLGGNRTEAIEPLSFLLSSRTMNRLRLPKI
jgi:hypothetical protein